tara:strand:- start:97 stop:759 length:663 start_codon:yes stop_codon:yes gene_type:complete
MPVQKFVSTEKHNIDGTTHVGDNNRVFFDVATKTFRLGDGVTPGGIVIAGGGGSGGLTGITDSTTGPVMVLTDVNVNIENSLTLESDQALNPVENTQYILYGSTSDANQTELFRDAGQSLRVPFVVQSTVFYEVEVVGRNNQLGEVCAFTFKGIIDRNQADDLVHVADQKEIVSDGINENYNASIGLHDPSKSLKVLVTGDAQYEMAWVARVKLTQVTHT